MVVNFLPKADLTTSELFIAQKLLELLHPRTLDSYRVKMHNPYTILVELRKVLADFKARRVWSYEKSVKPIIEELLGFLRQDEELLFFSVSKRVLIEQLESATKKDPKNIKTVVFSVNACIQDNLKDYLKNLFDAILKEAEVLNGKEEVEAHGFEKCSRLINYMASGLVNMGYSKMYLYLCVKRNFSLSSTLSFEDGLLKFQGLVNRNKEDYTVVFRLNRWPNDKSDIKVKSEYLLNETKIEELAGINVHGKNFFRTKSQNIDYLGIKTSALDHYSVVEKAKAELFKIIDILHLGYQNYSFTPSLWCFVVGSTTPGLSNTKKIRHYTDGNYGSNQERYESFIEKLNKADSVDVSDEARKRLTSAIRHLRFGNEADSKEQKFLHYWIGLEYFFSSYDDQENTISRLKSHFIDMHSTMYVKRNFLEFFKDLERVGAIDFLKRKNVTINSFDDLIKKEILASIIINTVEVMPLVAYRASHLKRLFEESDKTKVKKYIENHRSNLSWHLARCYRVRNELVHDASIDMNIESLVGNIRYYLSFVLNSFIDYLIDSPKDLTMDSKIANDDFFINYNLKFLTLEKDSFQINEMLKQETPVEMFA